MHNTTNIEHETGHDSRSTISGAATRVLASALVMGGIVLSAPSASADPMDQWRARIFDNLSRQVEQFQRTPILAPGYDSSDSYTSSSSGSAYGGNDYGLMRRLAEENAARARSRLDARYNNSYRPSYNGRAGSVR